MLPPQLTTAILGVCLGAGKVGWVKYCKGVPACVCVCVCVPHKQKGRTWQQCHESFSRTHAGGINWSQNQKAQAIAGLSLHSQIGSLMRHGKQIVVQVWVQVDQVARPTGHRVEGPAASHCPRLKNCDDGFKTDVDNVSYYA